MSKIYPAKDSRAASPEFSETFLNHIIEIRIDPDIHRFIAWIDGHLLMSPKGWFTSSQYLPSMKSIARRRVKDTYPKS